MDFLEILPQAGPAVPPRAARETPREATGRNAREPSWTAALRRRLEPSRGPAGAGAARSEPETVPGAADAGEPSSVFFTPSRGTFELSGLPDSAAEDSADVLPLEVDTVASDAVAPVAPADDALAGFELLIPTGTETETAGALLLPAGLRDALGGRSPGVAERTSLGLQLDLAPVAAAPAGLRSLLSSAAGLEAVAVPVSAVTLTPPESAEIAPPATMVLEIAAATSSATAPLTAGSPVVRGGQENSGQAGVVPGFAQAAGAALNGIPAPATSPSPPPHADVTPALPPIINATPETSDAGRPGPLDAPRTPTADGASAPSSGLLDSATRPSGLVPSGGEVADGPQARPAEFAARLARSLLESHQAGRPLHVRLHPPELGVLQIELSRSGGAMTARLDVETAAARQMILEQLPQLREVLAHTGHTVERIDVHLLESSENRAPHGERRHAQGGFAGDDPRQQSDHSSGPAANTDEDQSPRPPHIRVSRPATIDAVDIQV